MAKVDNKIKAERVYQVSLMLRRKPIKFIIEYMIQEWNIEKAQAYRYIKEARKEWEKYFANMKSSGIGYHVAQIRDLKDMAFNKKTVIGNGEDRQVIKAPNLALVLDIMKEEAKLMGVYPAEKHEETHKVIILGTEEKPEDKEE